MRRRGFSLPEVLTAILVFSVGILGLAATGTFVASATGDARALTEGATIAGSLLDSLRSTPCRAVAAGSATRGGAAIRWSVAPAGPTIAVTATLTIARHQGPRQVTIDALLPCER